MARPSPKRWWSCVITLLVFTPLAILGLNPPSSVSTPLQVPGQPPGWPMLGGSPQRNMVNLFDKRLPDDWDVKKGANIKWAAKLGTRSFGGPVIAGGKIFIGTNNDAPRNPAIKGDKGVLMCFRESDGKFLWQALHDKRETGMVNDWPNQGLVSTPVVEGSRGRRHVQVR